MKHRKHILPARSAFWLSAAALSATAAGFAAEDAADPAARPVSTASLADARELLDTWIAQQQTIAKERLDAQQRLEILRDRVSLVKQEITDLQDAIRVKEEEAQKSSDAVKKAVAEGEAVGAEGKRLAAAVSIVEKRLRDVLPAVPEPIRVKMQPLTQRLPQDPETTTTSIGERFQTVLGILNEINRVNNEIMFNLEVHTLANGNPAQVETMYVGLGQAYFVSSGGSEAGIGRPSPGWAWENSREIAPDVVTALEILQGKHSPSFVPLPVKIQ